MSKTFEIDIDDEWQDFCEGGDKISQAPQLDYNNKEAPKGTDIYISTKTKITYLSHPINLSDVFWKIRILQYYIPEEGIIKKQMKFNFINEEEVEQTNKRLEGEKNVDDMIITEIRNPDGRIKFKVIKKISIGMCSKDITSYRSKKKGAFYNCFVLILRIMAETGKFKEVHVKVFNTGKLEIPGIRDDKLLMKVMDKMLDILRSITGNNDITYDRENTETVLINSNFNCGY